MKQMLSRYWAYQFFGWGLFILINVFFAFTFEKFTLNFIGRLLIFVSLAFTISHLMRYGIIRSNVLMRPIQQQLVGFIVITLIFAITVGYLESLLTQIFDLRSRQEKSFTESKIIISNTFSSFVYLFMWNCIYVLYHYIQKSRRQEAESLRLEAQLKELELKSRF